MTKIKEIIVVEGKDDTRRLKEVFDIETIETNGSALDEATLQLIKKAAQMRGVIVLTDPDYSGEQIRKQIMRVIPEVKHAFITKKEARPTKQGSLGVEHASDEALVQALQSVMTPATKMSTLISRSQLMEYGLIAGKDAKLRRQLLGEKLHIGYTNAKQLQKRLQMFQITPKLFEDTMKEIIKDLKHGK